MSKAKTPGAVLVLALAPRPDLSTHVRPGLQALEKGHRHSIEDGHRATDSLSFDEVEASSPCFDYLLGVADALGSVAAVEFHSGRDCDVPALIRKQQRTVELLGAARAIVGRWLWVGSGGHKLSARDNRRLSLKKHRIEGPFSRLRLVPAGE